MAEGRPKKKSKLRKAPENYGLASVNCGNCGKAAGNQGVRVGV